MFGIDKRIYNWFIKPWALFTVISNGILVNTEASKSAALLEESDGAFSLKSNINVLDVYANNMNDGIGDISFILNSIVWMQFYATADNIDLKIRMILLDGRLKLPTENLSINNVEAFINKFYGGSLKDALHQIHDAAACGDFKLPEGVELPGKDKLGKNDLEVLMASPDTPTHILKFSSSNKKQFLQQLKKLNWDRLQSIILTSEYDEHAAIIYVHDIDSASMPQNDKNNVENKSKIKTMTTGWFSNMLTPLPFLQKGEYEYLPTNLKNSGSSKVIFIYMKNDDIEENHTFKKWFLSLLQSVNQNETVTVLTTSDEHLLDIKYNILRSVEISKGMPTSCLSFASKEINYFLNKFYQCYNPLPIINFVSTGFISNQLFNELVADKSLDGLAVTGDQSLGSALKYRKPGQLFLYQSGSHKRRTKSGMKYASEIDNAPLAHEYSTEIYHGFGNSYNVFKKLKELDNKFGLERKFYCRHFPDAKSCI